MRSMTDDALVNHSCLDNLSYNGESKFTGVVTAGKISKDLTYWDDRSRLRSEIPLTDFLYPKECKNYC